MEVKIVIAVLLLQVLLAVQGGHTNSHWFRSLRKRDGNQDRNTMVGEAVTFCEEAVPAFCIQTTCPQYCETDKTPPKCKSECKADGRCKLRPEGGKDDPKNQILDAQNREQLWACIAEKRDPNNTSSGRRDTPWQKLQSPSFRKAIEQVKPKPADKSFVEYYFF